MAATRARRAASSASDFGWDVEEESDAARLQQLSPADANAAEAPLAAEEAATEAGDDVDEEGASDAGEGVPTGEGGGESDGEGRGGEGGDAAEDEERDGWDEVEVELPGAGVNKPPAKERGGELKGDITAVDKQLLLIEELTTSEEQYSRYLDLLHEVYLQPVENRDTSWKRELLAKREVAVLWSYVEHLRLLSRELARDLERAHDAHPGDVGARVEQACRVVADFSPMFRLYAQYAAAYHAALVEIHAFEQQQTAFSSFLSLSKITALGDDLDSLLIMPVQRLPRYQMFLEQTRLESQEESQLAAAVSRALERVRASAVFVNEAVRGAEQRQQLVELQKLFARDRRVDLVSGFDQGRRLLKVGNVVKVSQRSNKLESLQLSVFSDMVLYSQQTKSVRGLLSPSRRRSKALELRRMVPARDVQVSVEATAADDREGAATDGLGSRCRSDSDLISARKLRFMLTTPDKVLELYARSEADRDDWVKVLQALAAQPRAESPASGYAPAGLASPGGSDGDGDKPQDPMPDAESPSEPYEAFEARGGQTGLQSLRDPDFLERQLAAEQARTERDELAEQFWHDEARYSERLGIAVATFVRPMLAVADGARVPGYSAAARARIADVDVVVALHSVVQLQILHEGVLERAMESHTANADADAVMVAVLRALHTLVPLLGLYSALMARRSKVLGTVGAPELEALRRNCERDPRCQGEPMADLFAAPLERLQHYEDTLEGLVRCTGADEAERAELEQLLLGVQAAARASLGAEETRRNFEDLVHVQGLLVPSRFAIVNAVLRGKPEGPKRLARALGAPGAVPVLVDDTRAVLLEGTFVKVCAGAKPYRCKVWLFNDCIIYASGSTKAPAGACLPGRAQRWAFRRLLPIANCFAEAAPQDEQAPGQNPTPPSRPTPEQVLTGLNDRVDNPYWRHNHNALKLRSDTKSFLLLADAAQDTAKWAQRINAAACAARGGEPVPCAGVFYAPVLFPLRFVSACMGLWPRGVHGLRF